LLNEALDSDGLIAMSVLAPGWETDYDGRPAILPHVCLGKVVTHQRLPDGRYNIMLLGSRRARILRELPPERSFRVAEIELIEDFYPAEGADDRNLVQLELSERFQKALPLPEGVKATAPVKEFLSSDIPLGVLTDLVSFALPLKQAFKCELLAEADVDSRARMLLRSLAGHRQTPANIGADFPPRFSRN
jgi:Lon protease-like protein